MAKWNFKFSAQLKRNSRFYETEKANFWNEKSLSLHSHNNIVVWTQVLTKWYYKSGNICARFIFTDFFQQLQIKNLHKGLQYFLYDYFESAGLVRWRCVLMHACNELECVWCLLRCCAAQLCVNGISEWFTAVAYKKKKLKVSTCSAWI